MAERTLMSFDWAMKTVLRQRDNFDILEGFLSTLLEEDITIVNLLDTESNKDNETNKSNRVDLLAEDGKKRQIIIELQYSAEIDFLERLCYGTSKIITDNMQEGYRYGRLIKVISVSIVYFNFLQGDYVIDYKVEGRGRFTEQPVKSDIFPEYHIIQTKWFDDNIRSELDEWVYLFKHSKIKDGFRAKSIQRAGEKLDVMKMPESERKAYLKHMDDIGLYESQIEKAKREGEDKGKNQKAIEIAKRMLKRKTPIEYIIEDTGLSEEEISKIEV